MNTWPTLLFFVGWLPESFVAQELPNPEIATDQFAKSFFRQNVCDLQEAFHNKSVSLGNALKGHSIRPFLIQSEYFRLDPETGGIPEDYPGLKAVILDKLAERAGFSWRNSYAVTGETPVGNHTWTELLLWSAEAYDVSADWWAFSIDRLGMGLTFPAGWYDGSIIMVTRTEGDDNSDSFSFWSWLKPFDDGVWWLIVLTIVFSGFVYWILENIDKNSDRQQLETNVLENIWLSAITFTTHFEFRPRTNAARLFTLSLSFWAMLVAAAYTANLASFLVVRNAPKLQVTSVSDAVRQNVKICTQRSAQSEVAVSNAYPNANFVQKETEKEVLAAVRDGECVVAITTVSTWDNWERNAEVNGQCNIHWVGRPFKVVPAGFATISDSGTFCTSIITDVLNFHMLRLKEEGFIEEAWKQHLDRKATIDCNAMNDDESTEEVDNEQLTLADMCGVFFFHGLLSFIALAIALIYKFTGWDQIPRFAKTGPMSRKSVRQTLETLKPSQEQEQVDGVALGDTHRQLLRAAKRKSVREVLQGSGLETTTKRILCNSEPDPSRRRLDLEKENDMTSSDPVLPQFRTTDIPSFEGNSNSAMSNFGKDEPSNRHADHDALLEDLLLHDLHGPAVWRNCSSRSISSERSRPKVTFADGPSSSMEKDAVGLSSSDSQAQHEWESIERLSQRQEEQARRQDEQMRNVENQISQIMKMLEKNNADSNPSPI